MMTLPSKSSMNLVVLMLLVVVTLLVTEGADYRAHRGHHALRGGRYYGNAKLVRSRRYDDLSDSSESEDSDGDDDGDGSITDTSSEEDDSDLSQRLQERGRRSRLRARQVPERRHDAWDVDVVRVDPVRQRGRNSRRGRKFHGFRRQRINSPIVPVQGAMVRDEPLAAVGGKTALSEILALPVLDDLLPHLSGNLQVGPKININWNIGDLLGLNREWWKGPNVCQSEHQTESNSTGEADISRHGVMSQTQCDNTQTAYTCTTVITVFGNKKTFVTTYECCYGYQRVTGEAGCTEELQLTDLISTAERLNLTQFNEAATSVGFDGLLQRGNFTVFVPLNEAFDSIVPKDMEDFSADYYDIVEITPAVVHFAENLEQVLGGHLVEGFYKSSRLEDEMLLETVNPKAMIRINKYEVPTRLVTANCQPIVSIDNLATNGVIHVVSGMLNPVEESLLEIVGKDPELSTLKTLLAKTGLSSDLSEVPAQFTLFAPTNAAFSKMDPKKLDRLLTSGRCLTNVLKQHLVGNVICSSVLQSNVRTRNLLAGYLHFNKSGSDLLVGEAVMTEVDKMATNGVLHKIDEVLLPDQALDLLDIAKKAGATDFLELVSVAALAKTLQTEENITIFVPSNEAIQSLPNATLDELRRDPVALAKILKFHIVPEVVTGRDLCDGKELDTLESSKKIQIKDYSSFPFGTKSVKTVECAPVNVKYINVKACNGIIHMIDKVMLPPQGNVMDVLSLESRFSTLVNLLKKSGIADQLQLSGPFTFFAPTNEAFEKLPEEVMEGFTQGTKLESLKKLLKHHIMHDTLCCSGIISSRFYLTSPQERMLDGSTVVLAYNRHENPTVNNVPIASCDITATNGMIHAIDYIIPEAVHKYTPLSVHNPVSQGSRTWLGRIMERVNSRLERVNSRLERHQRQMDDSEWEFEWPEWMKLGF